MFKFKSYNIKKAEKKNESSSSSSSSSSSTGTLKKTTAPSYSTGTLKKTTSSKTTSSSYVSPKKKTMPSAGEMKAVSNKQSPEYSKKIYPKKTVTDWHSNKTFSAKNETKKVVIPSPHKKLERK